MGELFCVYPEDWRRIKELVTTDSCPEWKAIEEIKKIIEKYPKFK